MIAWLPKLAEDVISQPTTLRILIVAARNHEMATDLAWHLNKVTMHLHAEKPIVNLLNGRCCYQKRYR
jgi:hypothetical protein